MKFLVALLLMFSCNGCALYGVRECWEAKDLAKQAIKQVEEMQERLGNLEERVYTDLS